MAEGEEPIFIPKATFDKEEAITYPPVKKEMKGRLLHLSTLKKLKNKVEKH